MDSWISIEKKKMSTETVASVEQQKAGESINRTAPLQDVARSAEQNKQSGYGDVEVFKEKPADVFSKKYRKAYEKVGTHVSYTENRDVAFVKEKLAQLDAVLKTPVGGVDNSFYETRNNCLLKLNEVIDACDDYARMVSHFHMTSGFYAGYYKKYLQYTSDLSRSAMLMRSFYGGLSQKKFESLRSSTLGDAMLSASNGMMDSSAVEETDTDIMTLEHGKFKEIEKRFWNDNEGGASKILEQLSSLDSLYISTVPDTAAAFDDFKDVMRNRYRGLIKECSEYINSKTHSFTGYGVERLTAVRQIMHIALREEALIKSKNFSYDKVSASGMIGGTWDDLFMQGSRMIKASETNDEGVTKGEVDWFSLKFTEGEYKKPAISVMAKALGTSSCYTKREKAVMIDRSGKTKRGYVEETGHSSDEHDKKGFKTYKSLLEFARYNELEITYDASAFEDFYNIRLMDYLCGLDPDARTENDFYYKVDIENTDTVDRVVIKRVSSAGNPEFLDTKTDMAHSGLINEKGEVNGIISPDILSKIEKLDIDKFKKDMSHAGTALNNSQLEALEYRVRELKNYYTHMNETKSGQEMLNYRKSYSGTLTQFIENRILKEGLTVPSYMKEEFIKGRKKAAPEANDIEKSVLKPEESDWITSEGEIKKSVSTDFDNEWEIHDGTEEDYLREKEQKKQKLKLMRAFRKTDTKSTFLMKKHKAMILEQTQKAKQGLPAGTDEDYLKLLDLITDYSTNTATAQSEKRLWAKRDKIKVQGETDDEKFNRIFAADKVQKEREALRDIRKEIDRLRDKYEAELKQGGANSALLTRQKAFLDYMKKDLGASADGELELPGFVLKTQVLDCTKTKFTSLPIHVKIGGKYTVETPVDEVMRNDREMPLFPHDPCIEDVAQGDLGDCYLVATLAAIVDRDPGLIRKMMKDNGNGTVTVRLFTTTEGGVDKYITVTKDVPVYAGHMNVDKYARNALWVQMIEKAFVAAGLAGDVNGWDSKSVSEASTTQEVEYQLLKKNGMRSYHSISGGKGEMVLLNLLGGSLSQHFAANYGWSKKRTAQTADVKKSLSKKGKTSGIAYQKDLRKRADQLLKEIEQGENKGAVMMAGSRLDIDSLGTVSKDKNRVELELNGFYGMHMYTLLGVRRIDGEPFIAVRNPWGAGVVERALDETTGSISTRKGEEDETGAFLVTPLEFVKYFGTYYIREV